jgi:hypothetical protein
MQKALQKLLERIWSGYLSLNFLRKYYSNVSTDVQNLDKSL